MSQGTGELSLEEVLASPCPVLSAVGMAREKPGQEGTAHGQARAALQSTRGWSYGGDAAGAGGPQGRGLGYQEEGLDSTEGLRESGKYSEQGRCRA